MVVWGWGGGEFGGRVVEDEFLLLVFLFFDVVDFFGEVLWMVGSELWLLS